MKSLLLAGLLLSLVASGSGCAMCASPWDCAYGTYGGKWQRGDQFHGRVNSAFESAGGMSTGGGTIIQNSSDPHWVHEGELEPSPDMTGR